MEEEKEIVEEVIEVKEEVVDIDPAAGKGEE